MKQKQKSTYATALDKENVGRLVQYRTTKRWLTTKLLAVTPEEYEVQTWNSRTPFVIDRYLQEQHNIIRLVPPELQKPAKRKRKPDPQKKQAKKPRYTQKEIEAMQSRALKLYNADTDHAKELGQALLRVRAAMPHGEFRKWWTANKLSQARVSYCLRLANGKHEEAKAKKKSAFHGANEAVRKEFMEELQTFLRSCHKNNGYQLQYVYNRVVPLIGGLLCTIGQLQEWQRAGFDEPMMQRAQANTTRAIGGLLNAMFASSENELTFAIVAPDTPKKPPQSEVPKRNAVESEAAAQQ